MCMHVYMFVCVWFVHMCIQVLVHAYVKARGHWVFFSVTFCHIFLRWGLSLYLE